MPENSLEQVKQKTAELLAQDRQKLLIKMPFVGGLIMRLDLVPVRDDRLKTAATDGDRIFVDVDFYGKLKSEERLFVLAHETWHCALMHFNRRQNRDQKLFNAAADLEIHFILTDEGLKAPFVLPHSTEWRGLSAEEIYEKLPKDYAERGLKEEAWNTDSGKESENIKGRGCGEGFDKHLEKNGDDDGIGKGVDSDYNPQIDAGTVERCRERLTAAVQMYQRVKGVLPAGLANLVEAILKPEIGWKELLAQFVTSCYGGSRRWLPPARRHVWQGVYLQSQRTERLRAVVAIDTSGSTCRDRPRFFSELNGLLNSFGSYELTVIQCDAEVGKIETFDDCNPLDPNGKWEVTGGGGTDFRPVFKYIDEHQEINPDLLIFFTDGYGAYPERAPAYPVLWLLTADGQCSVDWGTQVRFKAEDA